MSGDICNNSFICVKIKQERSLIILLLVLPPVRGILSNPTILRFENRPIWGASQEVLKIYRLFPPRRFAARRQNCPNLRLFSRLRVENILYFGLLKQGSSRLGLNF